MKQNVKLAEIASLSINQVIETLSKAYTKLILNGTSLDVFPSVMLWGQPGVGKSASIKQIGKNIEQATKKKVNVTDVRLLLFNPIDLRGIPVPDEEAGEKVARWLKPLVFKMNPSKDVINILFLDEISAAPQSVQAAAYQITLDKRVGEHKLPDNTIVIAAGNRVSDRSVAYKMPKALSNRLLHFDITCDFENWKPWAIENNIHPMILGFLSFRPDLLNTFSTDNDALAYATPRSWEMVSNLLNYIDENIDEVYNEVRGLIGSGNAIELRTWSKVYKNLPKIEDIFDGKDVIVPSSVSEVFAVTCAIIRYAKMRKPTIKRLVNAIKYAHKLPKDFTLLVFTNYLNLDEDIVKKLTADPEFMRFMSQEGKILNGQTGGVFKK